MKIPRLPWNEFFMLHAHLAATRSTCDRGPELFFDSTRHGVGCVIVKDKRIIAGGYNGSPPGHSHCDMKCLSCGVELESGVKVDSCPHCDSSIISGAGHLMRDNHCVGTLHSECNAILQCALHGVSPEGSSVYTTASPCYDCAKLLCGAKVKAVFFAEGYESRYGLSQDVKDLFDKSKIYFSQITVNIERSDTPANPLCSDR
jgi:dCMP deaminase